jgi:hypothetical protein
VGGIQTNSTTGFRQNDRSVESAVVDRGQSWFGRLVHLVSGPQFRASIVLPNPAQVLWGIPSQYVSRFVWTLCRHSHSPDALQGGIASVLDSNDSVDNHIRDTIVAGAYLSDEEAVEV